MTPSIKELLRALPPVNRLLELPALQHLSEQVGREPVLQAVREELASLRRAISAGGRLPTPTLSDYPWRERIEQRLERLRRATPRRVINATGVPLHTNLGRAPLADEALDALVQVCRGYCDLEYDLAAGGRGSRQSHVEELLQRVTGAESGLVVNNNAAAVLLTLSALAAGGEVIVSRGELVEIGGSFRIPDIITQGGARLVEVGTTNRTRSQDYARAVGPLTRMLLKVHRSNFVLQGFVAEAGRRELAALASERGLPLVEDLGSGCLRDLRSLGLPHEPTVQEALSEGMDLVTFSGDKLVGGPQAGIIVGKQSLIEQLRRHPLMRALRPDKLTLAALSATLRLYLQDRSAELVPVLRLLSVGPAQLRRRVEDFAARLRQRLPESRALVSTQADEAVVGGGSLPGLRLATWLLKIGRPAGAGLERSAVTTGPDALAAALRRRDPPVVVRIIEDAVALDLRCVRTDEEPPLLEALCTTLAEPPQNGAAG